MSVYGIIYRNPETMVNQEIKSSMRFALHIVILYTKSKL